MYSVQYNQSFPFQRWVQRFGAKQFSPHRSMYFLLLPQLLFESPLSYTHLLFFSVQFLSPLPSTGDQTCQGQINMQFFSICKLSFRQASYKLSLLISLKAFLMLRKWQVSIYKGKVEVTSLLSWKHVKVWRVVLWKQNNPEHMSLTKKCLISTNWLCLLALSF